MSLSQTRRPFGFRARVLCGTLALTCVGASGLSTAAPAVARDRQQTATQQRPNVLFLIADDQNADLGAYGAPVSTPNIDRLAASGTRFDRAYTQFPLCGVTRASFLSGLRPTTIGSVKVYDLFRCALPEAITLPQYFRQNGYRSVRVGKIFHQGVPNDIGTPGDDDGLSWDQSFNPRGRDKDVERQVVNMTPGLGLGRANAWLADDAPDQAYTDGKVADEAIAQLRAPHDKPLFLAVGFYRPHVPEIAPAKYFGLYPPAKQRLAAETPETLARVPEINRSSNVLNMGMTEAQQHQMIAAYRASTSFMDAQVGRVLDELTRQKLWKNTIVVFIGDHGFLLGQHGQWQKTLLWEEALRVPMIIRAPGMKPGVAQPLVEMVNLYPTLVQLAGLPAKAGLDGRSMLPLMTNPTDRRWTYPAYSQILGGRSIRTDRWRYTEWEGGNSGRELYDHRRDPREQVNLAGDTRYASVAAQLRAQLPAGPVEPRGKQTLSNPQGPAPKFNGRPAVEGCGHIDMMTQ